MEKAKLLTQAGSVKAKCWSLNHTLGWTSCTALHPLQGSTFMPRVSVLQKCTCPLRCKVQHYF